MDETPVEEPSVNGQPRTIEVDSELLKDVGHQLRNQLNAVVGAAGLLAAGAETSEERELAAIVEAGAAQVSRIVDEMLDAASLSSGEFELALHPFDVRATAENCFSVVADDASAKGLDVSFAAAANVPKIVIGDSRRLEQILTSLLRAAVDRTFRGGVSLELGCEENGGLVTLRFKIRDTGRGVPARILRTALEGVQGRYDKVEPGDRVAVLSLHTTKQLIEMMDGELHVEQGGVEAGPDAGTTFDFTVLAEAMPSAVATTQMTLEAMRVLVVSSDATERRVLTLQVE